MDWDRRKGRGFVLSAEILWKFCWMFYFFGISMGALMPPIGLNLSRALLYISTGLHVITNMKSRVEVVRNHHGKQFLLWYGLMLLYVLISQSWQFASYEESRAILDMTLIILSCFCLFQYVSTTERFYSMLKMLVYSSIILMVILIATAPLSDFASISTVHSATKLQRNYVGQLFAFCTVFSLFLFEQKRGKRFLFISVLQVYMVFMTISRKAILIIPFMIAIYIVFSPAVNRKLLYSSLGCILLVLAIYVVLSNPQLNERYGKYIWAIFRQSAMDSSAIEREFFRAQAMWMFSVRPWIGWGPDNFAYYLTYINYRPIGFSCYSHNNYTELLACYGIVGFALYYVMYIVTSVKAFVKRKKDPVIRLLLAYLITMAVFEYGIVSYYVNIYVFYFAVLFAGAGIVYREEKTLE